jgi:hypothetical protein
MPPISTCVCIIHGRSFISRVCDRSFRSVKLHIPSLSADSSADYAAVEGISNGMYAAEELKLLGMKNELATSIKSSVQTELQAIRILSDIKVTANNRNSLQMHS